MVVNWPIFLSPYISLTIVIPIDEDIDTQISWSRGTVVYLLLEIHVI